MVLASFASPSITGMMGWLPGTSVKPSFSIPERKYDALSRSFLRKSPVRSSISSTFNDAAAIEGASVLEKRYGRERCRSHPMISRRPEM